MLPKISVSHSVLENLLWFAGSLALAFFVWVIAVSQTDPIQERRLTGVPVQIVPDDGLLITNNPRETATVTVRGQRSEIDLLTNDDVLVWADLKGLQAGSHVVELQARVTPGRRARVAEIFPGQLPITLEMVAQRFVPVRANIINEPPPGYQHDDPLFDVPQNQVLINGPQSSVDQVVAAQVDINLGDQRNPMEMDAALYPVDVNGALVPDVSLDPQFVHVRVDIQRRNDVREVRVSPNILVDTLPIGYVLTSISYTPQVVLIGGSPDSLGQVPDTIPTAPIDLTDHTQDFEITVPVELPDPNLLVVGEQNITVAVGVQPRTANRQFDSIPLEITGLGEDLTARIAPDQVTVLVTGPQPLLETLLPDDLQVTVDVAGLGDGNYQIAPRVRITKGDPTAVTTSVLPAEIDVEIVLDTTGTPAAP